MKLPIKICRPPQENFCEPKKKKKIMDPSKEIADQKKEGEKNRSNPIQ